MKTSCNGLEFGFVNVLNEALNLPGSSTRHTEATVTQPRSSRITHKPGVGIRLKGVCHKIFDVHFL